MNVRRYLRNLIKRDKIEITVVSDGKNAVDRIRFLAVKHGIEVYPQLFQIRKNHMTPTDRISYKFVVVNAKKWCLDCKSESLDFNQVMDSASRERLVRPNLEATFLLCEYFVSTHDCPAPLTIFVEKLNLVANGPDSVVNIDTDFRTTRIMTLHGCGQWGFDDYLAFLVQKAPVEKTLVQLFPVIRGVNRSDVLQPKNTFAYK